MNIVELTKKIEESAKTRTREENIDLLTVVGLIDNDGFLSPNYYSDEVVEADRELNKPIRRNK